MRWPWRQKAETEDALQALEESQNDLAAAEERAAEARHLARVFRSIRRDDQFGPEVLRALEGR